MKQASRLLLALLVLAGCKKNKEAGLTIETAPVERREIVLDASATGVVEPINVVEVKSKASGQITKMTVETGSLVKPNDLLVQLDTRDVQNSYNQSLADLRAAEAKLEVSQAQRKRSDDLFGQRVITAQEHEAAALDYANAQASLVRARTNLDLSQQRLEDATVRAPVSGTIIEKTVSLGQVITSATGAFGGGTTLLKMADLGKVRVRALVNETDIGNVRAGQAATVTVDAYPDRPFRGTVEKIEPQAVVQQSVTMFPVLVSLDNLEGLLKPGMNGEVSVLIDRRNDVLTIPNDAVRNPREAATVAPLLGLDPDSVAAKLRSQFGGGGGGMPGMAGAAPAPGAGQVRTSPGEVALPASLSQGTPPQGPGGQRGQLVEVSDTECAAVKAAFAKKPEAQKSLDALRARVQSGELDMSQVREESQKIYAGLGVDGRVARSCQMRERMRSGDSTTGRRAPTGATGEAATAVQQAPRGGRQQGDRTVTSPVPAGEFPTGGRARTRSGLVFVAVNGTSEPRLVRLGIGNYDYTEVVSGLKEGERVALLAAASMQARRDEQNNRMRSMTGGGVPGMTRQPAGGAPAGGAGGAGGPRGGGGGPRP